MKKIFAFILSIFFFSNVAMAQDSAINFVKTLTDDIITKVLSSQIPDDEKLKIFHDRFKQDLALSTVGKHITATYWKKAKKEEQEEFLSAFLDFTTKSWADKFNLYTGQTIKFVGVKPAKSGQVFVTSIVENNPPAEVVWRLKKEGETFKITDIIIEGVSMVTSYRNEYTAFLHKNGGKLSTLTQELITKSNNFKFTKK